MRIIGKIIKAIFILLAVVLAVIILLIIAIIIIKPYGIDVLKIIPAIMNKNPTSGYDHPYLTTQQEAILESIGINPEDIPAEITPAMEECAVSVLGEKRANEIGSGSEPTLTEIIKLKGCVE